MVKSTDALHDTLETPGGIAFVHCVEGGFHLGRGAAGEIDGRVKTLRERGVVYITLAHLFWRRVATNAPAIPFIPDWLYRLIFCQPKIGLTERGRAAVEAMYRHNVMVDLSHMRQDAIDATLELIGDLDRETGRDPKRYPVIASHAGFRFGRQTYMLKPDTIRAIHARGGLVGLILAQHQINDGVRWRRTTTLKQTTAVLKRHIDKIHELTDGYDCIAIGSDLDGFIKPTAGGVEKAEDLADLAAALEELYPGEAEKMLSGNALRVLETVLGEPGSVTPA